MKGNLILAADNIIVDYHTKRVSAINIMEDFGATIFPFPVQFTLLMSLEKEESDPLSPETTIVIKINDKTLFSRPGNIGFSEGYNSAKNLMNLPPFIIPSPGTLSISLIQGEKEILGMKIKIESVIPAQPPSVTDVPIISPTGQL